jgi:hypothetical protein
MAPAPRASSLFTTLLHPQMLAAASTAATTPRPDAVYCAFHGNAFNPDTGKTAEYYQELSQCSDGPLRQDSNADDIGPLVAQEFGNIKQGSNSIFFSTPVSAIPAGRKATYICVVSAFHPKKPIRAACIGPSAATKLTMILLTSTPQLPIDDCQVTFQTVYFRHQVPNSWQPILRMFSWHADGTIQVHAAYSPPRASRQDHQTVQFVATKKLLRTDDITLNQ